MTDTETQLRLLEARIENLEESLSSYIRVINKLRKPAITYDVSMLPKGWTVEDVLKHFKNTGIVFTDSKS